MLHLAAATALGLAVTSGAVPTVTIAPGVHMPMVGIGTWQYNDSVASAAVTEALKLGYTHIDTALGYKNQVGVGKAIAASGMGRRELFVVSKIPGGTNETATVANLNLALEELFPGSWTDSYVDLMLVHFPATWGGKGSKAARQAEWRALEAFATAGRAKAIGISHYCRKHLDDILEIATVKPAVNQVQYHVGMGVAGPNATDDMIYMRSKGVTYEGFSPLCGPCGGTDATELITGEMVTRIGAKYGVTGPQVALKWQVQSGIPVIPKTSNLAHMAQNIDLFGFTLSDADMDELSRATTPAVAGDDAGGSGDCSVA